MFTGIVREVGSVIAVTGGESGIRLEISAPRTAPLIDIGGSVAINGVCLTAETVEPGKPLTTARQGGGVGSRSGLTGWSGGY